MTTNNYTQQQAPVLNELAKHFFDMGLAYSASHKDYEMQADKILPMIKEDNLDMLKELKIADVGNFINFSAYQTEALDSFDVEVVLKNFFIALKNKINNYTPEYLDFKGSVRQDSVPLQAFEFVGHNKELKLKNVDYSYLYK